MDQRVTLHGSNDKIIRKFRDMGDGTFAEVVAADVIVDGIEVSGRVLVTASDGVLLELAALSPSMTYNGDGTLNYVEVTYDANTYRQTFSYSGGRVSSITGWVKQ